MDRSRLAGHLVPHIAPYRFFVVAGSKAYIVVLEYNRYDEAKCIHGHVLA